MDLIITDIIMPGMSGLEMVQKISSKKSKRSVKALFVSGHSAKKLTDYEFDQSQFHFIEKPYTATELLAKVRDIFDN